MEKAWERGVRLLEEAGFEAYLVGGCVRDMLLGREAYDFDLCTSAKPEDMQRVFQDYKTVETGIKHGTLLVKIDDTDLEITTYRIEGAYEDRRHPDKVAFSDSLAEDLKRRDFTVNAMAYHREKGLVDLFGGRSDLEAGILRCVGEPEQRFREDALRILRGLRFSSQLGFILDKTSFEGMKREKKGIFYLSRERIRGELEKILLGKHLNMVLPLSLDILTEIFPEISLFEKKLWTEKVGKSIGDLPLVPLLRWTAFFYHLGGNTEEIMGRLSFSKRERREMLLLLSELEKNLCLDRKCIRRKLNFMGADSFFNLLAIKKVVGNCEDCEKIEEIQRLTRAVLAENDCFTLGNLQIKGEDLVKLGYEGKEIALCLEGLLLSVMDEQVENEREALLAYLRGFGR